MNAIRFTFNERKATQVAARLIQRAGGEMNYLALMKLLYIVDREALVRHGRPVTGDRVVAMKLGPVLSNIFDLVSCKKQHLDKSEWHDLIPRPEPCVYTLKLKGTPGNSELSQAEIELVDCVFEKYGRMEEWDLVQVTHTFPEWSDPGNTSVPIPFEKILQSTGLTDTQIASIAESAHAEWEMDQLLASVA